MVKTVLRTNTRKLTAAAAFLALCLMLPFLTGQIPQIGRALAPMHIPVLLCGFVCGWQYGLVVGIIAPLLRSAVFALPPMFPDAVAMAFEIGAYGLITGLLHKALPQRIANIYVTLIISMLAGRIVWGIARFIMAGLQSTTFSFEMFLAGAFVNAVPGIVCHIILVPAIVLALEKSRARAVGI